MFDSLQLVEQIVGCGLENLDEAVRKYEEKMFQRAVDHIEDGLRMNRLFFSSNAPDGFREWVASMAGA